MLKISNTLTGKKEEFKSIEPNKVKLYVCGVTPYDFAHLGHGRCYVTFDLLNRFLKYQGYQVTYVRNFTDVDDKTINKAVAEFGKESDFSKISERFINEFKKDVRALNCEEPQHQPKVTETISEIIDFVQGLIKKGKAYVAGNSVYFDISSFPEYGKLSKRNLEDLQAGARVEILEEKRNPLDFALWKGEPEGSFWKSPWGYGRPGWHIECSAMAKKFLGDTIDIHGGGMDLIFPHHENEIAQTESLTQKTFANHWVHNAFVQINKEKMSKSLGNFFTLQEIFKKFDPMVLRFYFLQHQYKAPLDFSFEDLEVAQKTYKRLCKLFENSKQQCQGAETKNSKIISLLEDQLENDLNTPGMWGIIFENIDEIKNNTTENCAVFNFLHDVLGLTLEPIIEEEIKITPEIQELIKQREDARKNKDWKTADAIRDKLAALGIALQDNKIKR
ncbi:MAG: Cysteine-tRNA ligase [candidate division TM6 bacterium GW2011_GWF2_32_72]|nr:MAG: Cysteine-tRNA ligase [candidate division TM6 bacterium GW2011_GWF2_32_72]